MVELRDAALSLRPVIDFVPADETEEKKARLKRFVDASRALYKVQESKRPFYPEEVYKALFKLGSVAWQEAHGYRNKDSEEPLKYWGEAQKNAKEISDLADQVLNSIHNRAKSWE